MTYSPLNTKPKLNQVSGSKLTIYRKYRRRRVKMKIEQIMYKLHHEAAASQIKNMGHFTEHRFQFLNESMLQKSAEERIVTEFKHFEG